MPKQALTLFAGKVANASLGPLTTKLIELFIERYHVNMSEAAQTDIHRYVTFNEFFTRALKRGIRPLSPDKFVCPVDGALSQFGKIDCDQIFQAKGHSYTSTALLGGDAGLAAQFENGSFATIYLSPKDYHRIHMPCNGHLTQMIHIPGDLFSVNPATARSVPGLFARNERVVCVFDSMHGQFVMVLVGATIVGSMATVWHGQVKRSGQITRWQYDKQNIKLNKGDEMGRFLLGSTVVMLFKKDTLQFNTQWMPELAVRMGETMAV
jgi:phosphatidylserine decarboxylase